MAVIADEFEFMTVEELAERLRVSTTLVRKLVRGGEVPGALRVGRRLIRFKTETITSWLDATCGDSRRDN